MTFITNVITTPKETQLDAFGRLRISKPFTSIDVSHVIDINDETECSKITGSGTITLNANNPSVNMTLTGAGTLVKQSRRRGIYQPSKSLAIYLTGIINNASNGTGVTSRIGYYDNDDGIYFEHRGDGTANGATYICLRSSNTGSVVNTYVAQANWNIDKMDGTGQSKLTLNPSKTIIYHIDIEWLGVGTVRVSVIINGAYYILHKFHNSNINIAPYMNIASQPLRYEIISTGATGSLNKICSAVVSEGGYEAIGRLFSASTGITTLSINNTTETPILSIRLKATYPKVNIYIRNISVLIGTRYNTHIKIRMFQDTVATSALTGASWTSIGSTCAAEQDINATAITTTGSRIISSGYVSAGTNYIVSFAGVTNTAITTNIDGLSAIFVITAQTLTGSDSVAASVDFTQVL